MLRRIKEIGAANADIAMVTNLMNLGTFLVIFFIAIAEKMLPLMILSGIISLCYIALLPITIKLPRLQLQIVFVLNYIFMLSGMSLYGLRYGFEAEAFFTLSTMAYFIYLAKGIDKNTGYIRFFTYLYCLTVIFVMVMTYYYGPLVPGATETSKAQCVTRFVVVTLCGLKIMYYQVKLNRVVNRNEENLKSDSENDALTGLYNRGKIQFILRNEFERTRDLYAPLYVAMMDIDDFKKINDYYGHNAGDYVLRTIGEILNNHVRMDGICPGRWGGEEFLILSSMSRNRRDFFHVMDRIRKEIEAEEFLYKGQVIPVTITAGMVSRSNRFLRPEEMVDEADTLLYKGKYEGKNRIEMEPEHLRDFTNDGTMCSDSAEEDSHAT